MVASLARRLPRNLVTSLLAACFIAAVLLLGTSASEVVPAIRLFGAVVGGVLIVAWIGAIRRHADLVDLATTAALVAFSVSCVLSMFPRQSFDAAVTALALTSALGVGRRALGTERILTYAVFVMAAVGIVLGLLVIVLWGRVWLQWLFLTGWQALPPLDLFLPSVPWAHQHDLASLLVMLTPAIWLQRGIGLKRILLTTLLVGIGVAVVMDGSRSVWLALAVATGATALRPLVSTLRSRPRVALAMMAVVGVLVIAAIATGTADELMKRLTAVRSIDARTGQWSAALGLWREDPIQGVGPGSFPFLLRLTDYFESYEFVSRHPDNAFVQLIAEVGVLGVIAAAAVIAALGRMWRRDSTASSMAAAWVLTFALVVSIGTNPFEYGFLLAPLVVWTAIGAPVKLETVAKDSYPVRARWLTPAIVSAASVIAVAQATTLVAALAYDAGSRAPGEGSSAKARGMLDLAVTLDPGMALYPRERGMMALIAGLPELAVADLGAATALNPADDVSYRSLAMAWLDAGDPAKALAAARSAARRDSSDLNNLLVLSRAASRAGDSASSTRALTLAVLHGPWITADPLWQSFALPEQRAADLLDAAVALWRTGNAPWLKGLYPAWLVGLAEDRGSAHQAVLEAGSLGPSAAALLQVLSCESQDAGLEALRFLEQTQGTFGEYWQARVIGEVLSGGRIDGALAETATLRAVQLEDPIADRIPPGDLYGGGLKDQYGYRRRAAQHVGGQVAPTALAGLAEWINRPVTAALAAGMTERVASCQE